jgi:hypothetical protein
MSQRNVYKLDLSNSHFFHTHYKQCTFPGCSYEFQEADWTYFGKDIYETWHHVCINHRENIQWACLQLFGHLPHEVYRLEPYTVPSYMNPPQPNTDLWLWRYMDFEKFASFIKTKSIFFPKAITFNDPLECAVSIKSREKWLNSIRSIAYPSFYESELEGLSEKEKVKRINIISQSEIDANKDFRKNVLISCWHANDGESEAMWQLYKGKCHQTVAVSINISNFRNSFPKPIHVGEVSYVTYEKVYPTKVRAFRKLDSYEHEKEIRAVLFPEHINDKVIMDITSGKTDKGIFLEPDKKYLQIRIHISPWCSDRFRKKVNGLIGKSSWNIGNGTGPSILEIVETRYEPTY